MKEDHVDPDGSKGTVPPAPGPGVPEDEPEQGFIRELSQFFIVPSLIVLLCVAIFVMFGLITSDGKSAGDYLQEIRRGRGSERWLAAFELSRLLAERERGADDAPLVAEIVAILEEEHAGDPTVRIYLIAALENLRHPAAAAPLIAALQDADPNVRLHAAKALGAYDDLSAAVIPLSALLLEEDAAIRKVAIHALGRTHDRAAVAHLTPRLEDPVQDVRWNAALALAVIGDPAGRDVIAEMLDRGRLDVIEGISEGQKISALINGVQAAYLLRDPALLSAVERLAREDPSLRVREVSLRVLEETSSR
jgi:HEAT repeat protein